MQIQQRNKKKVCYTSILVLKKFFFVDLTELLFVMLLELSPWQWNYIFLVLIIMAASLCQGEPIWRFQLVAYTQIIHAFTNLANSRLEAKTTKVVNSLKRNLRKFERYFGAPYGLCGIREWDFRSTGNCIQPELRILQVCVAQR